MATCAVTTVVAIIAELTQTKILSEQFRDWYHGKDPSDIHTAPATCQHELCSYVEKFHAFLHRSRVLIPGQWANRAFIRKFCAFTLQALADLQTITGIGILLAAYCRGLDMSLYHYGLVDIYWWLTINSMFAATEHLEERDIRLNSKVRLGVRIFFRICSLALGLPFEYISDYRIRTRWSAFESGNCLFSHHLFEHESKSTNWFWTATLILICISQWLSLGDIMFDLQIHRKFFENWVAKERYWVRTCRLTQTPKYLPKVVLMACKGFCVMISFILRNFIGVWGLWPCAPWVSILFYIYLWMDNTQIAISNRNLNQHLLVGSESDWGFGQILPVILLLAIVFNAMDAFIEAKEEQRSVIRSSFSLHCTPKP